MSFGAFDWLPFLERLGIEYVTRGPNVARGNINICCPFCGDDPSHHLGIALTRPFWGCFRDSGHRGLSPVRLIRELARCSWPEAYQIAQEGVEAVVEELDVLAQKLAGDDQRVIEAPLAEVRWPRELQRLDGPVHLTSRFLDYLVGRGFRAGAGNAPTHGDAMRAATRYELRGAIEGDFAWRLCFPITLRGRLVGWTGRAIAPAQIRYKTHPPGSSTLGRVLFNFDGALARPGTRRRVLFLCEGPLDVLKVDFYGLEHGVAAVGLLGLTFSEGKAELLGELAESYERVAILLDSDAQAKALDIAGSLSWLPGGAPRVVELPGGAKDPGELRAGGLSALFEDALSR